MQFSFVVVYVQFCASRMEAETDLSFPGVKTRTVYVKMTSCSFHCDLL